MFLRNITYRKKIMVLFLPVFFLTASGLYFVYTMSISSLIAEHSERLRTTARLIEDSLKLTENEMKKLIQLFQSNRTITEYLYISSILGADKEPLKELLRPMYEALEVDAITVFDRKGYPFVSIDNIDSDRPSPLSGTDMGPKNGISHGFTDKNRALRLTARGPLLAKNEFLGYIEVSTYMSEKYLKALKEISGDEILLVKEGRIITSSLNTVSDQYSPSGGKLSISGEAYSIYEKTISGMDGRELCVMAIALPTRELTDSINKIRLLIFSTLCLLPVLYCILSKLFISALDAPLKEIVSFIGKVSKGELKEELNIEGKDEIAELAGHFTVMQRQLRANRELVEQYMTNLEKAVAVRTAELEAIQKKLIEAEKMRIMGQVTGGVAHEVRNPLNAIMALTDAMDLETNADSEIRPYISHMRSQVDRLATLMNELLELGKPLDAEMLRRESVVDICRSAVSVWKHTPLGQSHSIGITGDEGISISADSKKFQQVIINLLDNAVQHGHREGSLDIVVSSDAVDATIRVTDRGRGIPVEVLPKVFETFFTTRRGGTGLGLSIVKNTIEMHGGTVNIFNSNPPPGCTVEIKIPLDGRTQS